MVNIAVNQVLEDETAQPIAVYNSFQVIGQAVETDVCIEGQQWYELAPGTGALTLTYQTIRPNVARGARQRYAQAVIDEGPEGYWRFDEKYVTHPTFGLLDSGGDCLDSSGHGHHAQPASGSSFARGDVDGLLPGDPSRARLTSSEAFLGVITVPYGAWMDSADWTIEGLFDSGSAKGTVWGHASSGLNLWEFGVDSGFHFFFRIGSTLLTSTSTVFQPATGDDGVIFRREWDAYHFAAKREGNNISLLVNGVVEATATYTGAISGNVGGGIGFYFGNRRPGDSSRAIAAYIDEFAYYTHAVDDAVLLEHAELFLGGQTVNMTMVEEWDGDRKVFRDYVTSDDNPGVDPLEPVLVEETVVALSNLEIAARYDPRITNTYRRAVLRDDPWGYWDNAWASGGLNGADSVPGSWTPDRGHRKHEMFSPDHDFANGVSEFDVWFGSSRHSSEAPKSLYSQGIGWYAISEDSLVATEFTIEVWLRTVSAPSGMVSLIGCAAASGSSTFDKCLFLNAAGKLTFLVGMGGSREVISAAAAFPVSQRYAHVVASVGPDGMKIEVDGTVVASGASTAADATPQHVFLLGGGQDGSYTLTPPTDNTLRGVPVMLAPAVYDKQLTSEQTSKHRHAGKSYGFLSGQPWSLNVALSTLRKADFASFGEGPGTGIGSTFTGTTPAAGPALVPTEPRAKSIDLQDGRFDLRQDGVNSTVPAKFAFNLVVQPTTLTAAKVVLLMAGVSSYSVGTGITTYSRAWTLSITGNLLTFTYQKDSTTTETFTHSITISQDERRVIGVECNGAALDLWVDGHKESFTRAVATFYNPLVNGNPRYTRLGLDIDGTGQFKGYVGGLTGVQETNYDYKPAGWIDELQAKALEQYVPMESQ